jgi:hypothetical protein
VSAISPNATQTGEPAHEIAITGRPFQLDVLGETCGDAVSLGAVPIKGYDQPQTVWRLG